MIDTARKAKIMQRRFGKTPDTICNGCKHLLRYERNGQVYTPNMTECLMGDDTLNVTVWEDTRPSMTGDIND